MNATLNTHGRIGIASVEAQDLATRLNVLLAHYQVFYQNVRGYHWNVRGEKFLEMHVQFEQLYTDLQLKIDELAERILTLGFTPAHTFTAYLQLSRIAVAENVSDWRQCLHGALDAFSILLTLQRDLLGRAAEAQDEGTNAMMSDYIRQQEKTVWMYATMLGN